MTFRAFVLDHWRSLVAAGLLLVVVIGSAILLWPRPAATVQLTPAPLIARPSTPSPPPALVIHVAGAVAKPGVYQLPAGSRVVDALTTAGGTNEEADLSALNLAAPLVDGQQVLVRARSAPPTAFATGASPGKVSLNLASAADLDSLPGVGPVLARRIVERRERLGPFQSIEQLRDEKLLPASTYERVKDLLSVN